MFELVPAEIVCPIRVTEGLKSYRVKHMLRPPSYAEWLQYFVDLRESTEIESGLYRQDNHLDEACANLWEKIARNVEGYRIKRDGQTCELPEVFPNDWRPKVPPHHKSAAIGLAAQVFLYGDLESEDGGEEEYIFDPELVQIRLCATRSGEAFDNLLHNLTRPSPSQAIRFSRATSRGLSVRGSKTRKTIIPTNLKEICALYDELIVSTEGYSIGGTATGDTRKEMDAIHKKVVVMGLFAPAFADETAKVSDGTN